MTGRVRNPRDDGSGTVWVLGLAGMILAAGIVALGWAGAVGARHRAEGAADLAALAGAGRALEGTSAACGEAGRVAARNGARLRDCGVDGLVVDVVVEVALGDAGASGSLSGLLPRTASARARAGPQDASGD
jgi:secretion/DNA translocation related TadE-like protein